MNCFQSHANFKEWFSNPLTGMVEDSQEYNESLVKRLHKVLRPFLLRRLKNEVEKQLPKKYEHTVHCSLSKRQRFLYDDFMSRDGLTCISQLLPILQTKNRNGDIFIFFDANSTPTGPRRRRRWRVATS